MTDRLRHRGPDAGGIYVDGPAGLGHRRLAVIDLRPDANQPMVDIDGRFVIVFNGEVYNYLELKPELEKCGARFRTHSDTEVVLEAYKHWGVDSVRRFNGMFAYAVWDIQEKTLFLARDRLGKKPLYYFTGRDGDVVFASELKALRAHPDVPNRLNPQAVAQFLTLNYILSSTCIFDGVNKLPPASYLLVRKGKEKRPICYWDLRQKFNEKTHFMHPEEPAEMLNSLLDDAVRLRMVSDVPLGAFLSGGLDSSAIAASMCRESTPEKVHTFSIGFEERGYNELPWAQRMANVLGVTHRDRMVTPDIAGDMDRIVYYADEPFADTSMLPMYWLAQFAREYVTVALSGDGGDELFAGYETYVADRIHRFVRRIPRVFVEATRKLLVGILPVSWSKVSLDYKIRQFFQGATLSSEEAHYSWRTMYGPNGICHVLSNDYAEQVIGATPFEGFATYFDEVKNCHYLDQAMYVDIKTWLVDDILVKVDRATMAHSLEARAPLLDYRLVEFAAALPVSMKLRGFKKKHILKESQKRRLPREVVYRSKKGFNAPVAHWITSSLGEVFVDVLESARVREVLNADYALRLLKEHQQRKRDHSLRLFGMLCFGLWLLQT